MRAEHQPHIQQQGQLTLLTGLSLVVLPFLFHLPLWVGLVLLGQLSLQAVRLHQNYSPVPKWILLLFVIASLGLIYLQFQTLLGLGAGSALLLLMLGFKVLETRNHRDVMISLLLGYFTVTTAFLFDQNILLLPYLLVSAFILTLALHQLNDVLGSQPVRRQLASTGWMFALAIPVMAVLFIIFPRISAPLWALPDSNTGRTGISDSMSPGAISQLLESNSPAFRVTFNQQQPPAKNKRYWRGPVLDQYDGKRWSSRHNHQKSPRPDVESTGSTIQYRMIFSPNQRNWIFPLDAPTSIPPGASLDHNYVLTSHSPIKDIRQFSITSSINYKLLDDIDAWSVETALQLPDHIAPEAKQLATQLISSSLDDEHYIQQVLDLYNRQNFRYTLQPRTLRGDHTDDFLFSTREGFCEHYASSFVVLMRHAGIPARVVTGYMGGEWNESARYLLIRQSDAHAWAEVWLADKGWLRIDPTAAVAPERIESSLANALYDSENLPMFQRINFLSRISLEWDLLNYYWTQWILSYDSGRQSQFLDWLGFNLNSIGQSLVTLFAGALAILSAWSLLLAVRYIRNPGDPVTSSYQLFIRKMERIGILKQAHETASQFAERIKVLRPELAPEAEAIAHHYELSHYGPVSSAQAVNQLRALVREFKPKKSPP